MSQFSEEFWTDRYEKQQTGWDLGEVSPPIKAYADQLEDKTISILIPGCGNGHEAEYLHKQGFVNVHILDLSNAPLKAFKERVPDFPEEHIHQGDFFSHEGRYDMIIEQTLFCAVDPSLRPAYAKAVHTILKPEGKLVGLLFGRDFPDGPPFGGNKIEYLEYFSPYFSEISMEECYNSVQPRSGNELFINLRK